VENGPFDPALGAKIFGEIQAEGLRAAGALVERLVHLVDGPHVDAPDGSSESTEPETAASFGVGAVQPWFELWRDLIERTSDTLQRLQGADVGSGGVGIRVGVDGSLTPSRPLTVAVDAAGRGQAEMWLHNGTADDPGELLPHCGPLCGLDGALLSCQLTIDPPTIDGLPPRSSRGFTIAVTADPASVPGTYRGLVQVRGAGAVWLPIEVVVPA
jgi:hypothetical protein